MYCIGDAGRQHIPPARARPTITAVIGMISTTTVMSSVHKMARATFRLAPLVSSENTIAPPYPL